MQVGQKFILELTRNPFWPMCPSHLFSLRKTRKGGRKEIPIKQNNRKPCYGHVEKRKVLGKLLKKSQIAHSLFVCYWIKAKVIGTKKSITQEAISYTIANFEMWKTFAMYLPNGYTWSLAHAFFLVWQKSALTKSASLK